MRFFAASFLIALRTRLSRPHTWALLVLLPLLMSGASRLLPAEEVSAPVQVGVVLPEEGGGEFWKRLEQRSGLAAVFHRADRVQAERQVALGRWDCALVLPEDFEARLAGRDAAFTLLIGPGSTAYPLVREAAFACAAELASPAIAEEYLLDSGIVKEEELPGARPRLNRVLLDQERVLVSMETVDGRSLDPLSLADSGADVLVSGLTAVLLLVWILFTAMDLGRWLDAPCARRLAPLQGPAVLLLPQLAAALLPALCSGALEIGRASCRERV